MQLTSQTRLTLSDAASQQLDAYARYYAKHLHKLYAWVANRGGAVKSHKTEFCRRFGISARLFNALAIQLQGMVDGTRELLKQSLKNVQKAIKSKSATLKTYQRQSEQVTSGKWLTDPAQQAGRVVKLNKLTAKLKELNLKRDEFSRRLAANVPGICFGSRKLFMKQYHLQANGFKDHADWKAKWQEARAHQVSFIGSKDETAGNVNCALFEQADGSLKLRIRLPDTTATGLDKYLWLEDIKFPHDEAAIRAALAAGQALSYRLHRGPKHWRLLVSFKREAAPVVTKQAVLGCVGVDFNADHLAVAQTDLHGNIIEAWRKDLDFADKSSGQRQALLQDALQEIVLYAKACQKPLVMEDLDFQAKKQQMGRMSKAKRRMLSGLSYAQYPQFTAAKCFRLGVQLLVVNPAYTSVIGRIKYAVPYGRSVHLAAAGVIARRGQGLSERLPCATSVRIEAQGAISAFLLPVRTGKKRTVAGWASVHRSLTDFLRKSYLATLETRRRTRTAPKAKLWPDAKPNGAKGGSSAGVRAGGPSNGTAPLWVVKSDYVPMDDEQI